MTPPALQRADRELLERLGETTDVQTSTVEPGIGEYFAHLVRQLTNWVQGLLTLGAESLGLDDPHTQWLVARILLISAALLAAAVVIHLLLRWWRTRRRPAAAPLGPTVARETVAPPTRNPESWREQLRERLTAGDTLGALEALWWWLGTRLAGERLDPAWTSGELLRHTGHDTLRPELRQMDRLRYGPEAPAAAAVETLAATLDTRLAGERGGAL